MVSNGLDKDLSIPPSGDTKSEIAPNPDVLTANLSTQDTTANRFERKNFRKKDALLAAGQVFIDVRKAISGKKYNPDMIEKNEHLTPEWKSFFRNLARVMSIDMEACSKVKGITMAQLKIDNLDDKAAEKALPARLFEIAYGVKPQKSVIIVEASNVITLVVQSPDDYYQARGIRRSTKGSASGFLDRNKGYSIDGKDIKVPSAVVLYGTGWEQAVTHEWGHNVYFQSEEAYASAVNESSVYAVIRQNRQFLTVDLSEIKHAYKYRYAIEDYQHKIDTFRGNIRDVSLETAREEYLADYISTDISQSPDRLLIAVEHAIMDEGTYEAYGVIETQQKEIPDQFYRQLQTDRNDVKKLLRNIKDSLDDAILTIQAFGLDERYRHGLYLALSDRPMDEWKESITEFMGEEINLYRTNLKSSDPEAIILQQLHTALEKNDMSLVHADEVRKSQPKHSKAAFKRIKQHIADGKSPAEAFSLEQELLAKITV